MAVSCCISVYVFFFLFFFLFFQAEDGIRDLVRSRGLGDVYKRQIYALLGSHPDIAMTRRTNLWTHFYGQYGDLAQPENFERCLAMMLRYKRVVRLDPDPERIRREFMQSDRSYAALFALLGEHFAERQGKMRWGDKSLTTERYAELIFAAFP